MKVELNKLNHSLFSKNEECPFCFSTINTNEVQFRVDIDSYTGKKGSSRDEKIEEMAYAFLDNNNLKQSHLDVVKRDMKKYYEQETDRRSDITSLKDQWPKYFSYNYLMETVTSVDGTKKRPVQVLDRFGFKTAKRICPKCGVFLPSTFGLTPIKKISLIGNTEAGKTMFLASLLHFLRSEDLKRNFDISYTLSDNDEETMNIVNVLSEVYEKNTASIPATNENAVIKPIFITFFKEDKKLTIALYDIAGEILKSRAMIKKYKSLYKSDAYIFLEPLDHIFDLSVDENGKDISKGRDSILTEFRSAYSENSKEMKALAIYALSKADLIKQQGSQITKITGVDSVDAVDILTRRYPYKDVLDLKVMYENDEIIELMKSFKKSNSIDNLNDIIVDKYTKLGKGYTRPVKDNLFVTSLSTTGYYPKTSTVDEILFSPSKIDEPLLWLLYKYGMIEGSYE